MDAGPAGPESEGAVAAGASDVCARCGAEARMQCPKCLELKLPRAGAAFCSKDCFSADWPEHKKVHRQAAVGPPTIPGFSPGWLYCLDRGRQRSVSLMEPRTGWTGTLRPWPISPPREVPAFIARPDWADTGLPAVEMASRWQMSTPIRTPAEIAAMRDVCRIGREVLDIAARAVKAGVTTDEIDRIVHEATVAAGGYPSPLNYHSFPKSCCTSVNEVICHGIPDARPLAEGDIVNIDVTVYKGGHHGDLNETFCVGTCAEPARHLIRVAYECLERAIAVCKPGVRFRDVGEVIARHAAAEGTAVVKSYCGHGIGDLFHCAPNIPHYAKNKAVGVMKPGMTFTIEPMINAGVWRDAMWPDGWTAITEDGKPSAQFEHTLLVTETGVEVLTARLPTSPPLTAFPATAPALMAE